MAWTKRRQVVTGLRPARLLLAVVWGSLAGASSLTTSLAALEASSLESAQAAIYLQGGSGH